MNRSRFHLHPFAAAAAFLVLSTTATAVVAADPMTTATGGTLASGDRTFVEKAALGGMTEVQASKLAESKTSNPAVKDFATHMVGDHTKAGDELTKIAAGKSVTTPGTLDKSHQGDVDKLAKLSGDDFDKAYVKQMLSDHKSTVSLFEKEAKSGKDADLQAFAGKTLPTLQGHLKSVQDLSASMK